MKKKYLFKSSENIFDLCVFVSEHVHTGMPMQDAHGGWKGALDSLQLKLQMVMSCLIRVPGTELGSSARAVSIFNCSAISWASQFFAKNKSTNKQTG